VTSPCVHKPCTARPRASTPIGVRLRPALHCAPCMLAHSPPTVPDHPPSQGNHTAVPWDGGRRWCRQEGCCAPLGGAQGGCLECPQHWRRPTGGSRAAGRTSWARGHEGPQPQAAAQRHRPADRKGARCCAQHGAAGWPPQSHLCCARAWLLRLVL
jgi:hypothetical protein